MVLDRGKAERFFTTPNKNSIFRLSALYISLITLGNLGSS